MNLSSSIKKILTVSLFVSCLALAYSQENIALVASETLTSHVSPWEDIYAINNNIEPESSVDKSSGAYGNWTGIDNVWQWLEYDWDQFYYVEGSDVYWWTDGGGIQLPYETYQQYWDFQESEWVTFPDVDEFGVEGDQYNVTRFTPVLTSKVRVYMRSTAATGVLEWKIWGVLGEQVPVNSSVEIDTDLQINDVSNILVTAKNENSEAVENYSFKLNVALKNELAVSAESYIINGVEYTSSISGYELPPTSAAGEIVFSVAVPAIVDPADGLSIQVLFNDGITKLGEPFTYYESGLNHPQITPVLSENTVDSDIELSFADDAAWRMAIEHVYINGVLIEDTKDYEIISGIIQLKPSGGNPILTVAGTKTILIEALGYEDLIMDLEILPGIVDLSETKVMSQTGLYQPTKTNIEIIAKDQFGNFIEGYKFGYDVTLTKDDATSTEIYSVAEVDISDNLTGQETGLTDSFGSVKIPLKIPRIIDLNDGILISFSLEDNTPLKDSIQYINDGSQKEILLQNGVKNNAGFSWDRTAQSENFIVYWGEKIIGDPSDEANGNLSFEPENVLNILENLLSYFNDTIGFIENPDSLNMGKYKFEVVMNETWNTSYTGWAFGGLADGKIGGMWIHPQATNGPATLAHEFTHMNQAMVFLQYPGYGLNMPYAGFFWECHAQFMMKTYTGDYRGVQPERYIFTSMMQFSTTRRHYQNVYFMDHLEDRYGMQTVNDIWRKADRTFSHPLTSLRDSVLRYSQDDLIDEFGYHAMKNVTWDYSKGENIRSAIRSINPIFVQRMYTILDTIAGEPGRYIVPEYLAPGDYGYNIIQLFPDEGSNEITIDFDGLDNEPSGGACWRYGFVGVDNQDTPRYSQLYRSQSGSASFSLTSSDSAVYLVVVGAPAEHHNYPWEPGYPKVYRYPYTLRIAGALPAGYKSEYNSQKAFTSGAPHSNGGGWVASTANVALTAFVGPNAQVLGAAQVLDDARIEDYAIVTDNAKVRNSAIIRDHAIVGGGSVVSHHAIVEKSGRVFTNSIIKEYAVVTGSALIYNTTLRGSAVAKDLARLQNVTISGTAIIGGDAEQYNGCSEGTYLEISRTASLDGLIDHPSNLEVNPSWLEYIYPKGEKPAPPMNLTASNITNSEITLTWDKADDFREIESYYLYRNNHLIEIVNGTSIVVSGLPPANAASYFIKAVDRSGNVSGKSEDIEVTTLLSSDKLVSTHSFKVFPNPVEGCMTIETGLTEEVSFIINNVNGQEVLRGKIKESIVIDKSEIGMPGVYFLTINGKKEMWTRKITLL